MELATALAMFVGFYDASCYSAVQDRMRFPDDLMLRQWIRNNSAYHCECTRQRDSLCLTCSRPADREAAFRWYEEEIEEAVRIRAIMWQIADVNFGQPPWKYREDVLRGWMREARSYMTEEEYAAGYIPFGGIPAPGWRERRLQGRR